jgi:putative PIN family toxin of toxin-antitoxin system
VKIVFDSNVVISAFACPGICRSVYKTSLKNHEVCLCDHLLGEIEAGFVKKLKMPANKAIQNIQYVRENCRISVSESVGVDQCRDPDDLPVLGLASAVQAQLIVSGDADLRHLKKFKKTRIVSPRELWELIREKENELKS